MTRNRKKQRARGLVRGIRRSEKRRDYKGIGYQHRGQDTRTNPGKEKIKNSPAEDKKEKT